MSTSAGNGGPGSLIAEARAGSPDALSALYLEHGGAVFRLAVWIKRGEQVVVRMEQRSENGAMDYVLIAADTTPPAP